MCLQHGFVIFMLCVHFLYSSFWGANENRLVLLILFNPNRETNAYISSQSSRILRVPNIVNKSDVSVSDTIQFLKPRPTSELLSSILFRKDRELIFNSTYFI